MPKSNYFLTVFFILFTLMLAGCGKQDSTKAGGEGETAIEAQDPAAAAIAEAMAKAQKTVPKNIQPEAADKNAVYIYKYHEPGTT